jgi:hypothetical protein
MTQVRSLDNSTPAAPGSSKNLKWQLEAASSDPAVIQRVSGYMEYATALAAGLVPTPPNDVEKALLGDMTYGYTSGGVNPQTGTSYAVLSSDKRKLVTGTNGSSQAYSIAAASSMPVNFWFMLQNRGAGALTLTPTTSTIDGAASLTLTSGQGCIVFSDGTNYFTMRGVGGSGGSVTESSISLSDVTTDNVTSSAHGFAPKSPADATKFLNGDTTPAYAQVKDSDLSTSDVTTNNVTSSKHGLAPKSPADATKFLNGDTTPAYAQVKDSDLSLSDITTNDASTSKHGFLKKLPNDASKFLDGTGAFSTPSASSVAGVTISSSAPRVGDTFRYKEYGSAQYDLVIGIPRFMQVLPEYNAGGIFAIGYAGATNAQNVSNGSSGGSTLVAPTGTEAPLQNFVTGAGAATTTPGMIGLGLGTLNAAKFTAGCVRRFAVRAKLKNTTNVRYWIGLCFGGNNIGTTTAYATDTPNGRYIMFRYSSTTDATIKAVTATSNAAQTVADTTISIDTSNTVLFEIVYDGSNAYFYINGTLTNTIGTNLLATTDLVQFIIAVDNKNTANNREFDFAWMTVTLK